MGHLETIEKAAQKLIALCQKEKQTKTDKEKMLVIHAEILTSIEDLSECDLCGAISELIVTMTLADATAKVCKECGIKSLEAGEDPVLQTEGLSPKNPSLENGVCCIGASEV